MNREDLLTLSRTTSHSCRSTSTPQSRQNGIGNDNSNSNSNSNGSGSGSGNGNGSGAKVDHAKQPYVFADPVAFRHGKPSLYLEEDRATGVIERHGELKGYEVYVVEQWACSRAHPTFVITTYTGDDSHKIQVGVLGIPADKETWNPRLRVYFNAIAQHHARPKDTPLGTLMITNLSSFPSGLNVIPVPNGDVRKHRGDFIVNENLKRLGCSGRSGMSFQAPAAATQAKFFQLYKTSDRIPLYGAVVELVKLCQVALMIFGKLEQEYADGCLCDVTERAINDWWTEIGSEYYNIEPSDGILGPTTVAALLGLLMGARNRLNHYGAPVAKDAFDVTSLKRGIAYFQKSQKMDRTRRLDRHTLQRLHQVTAKGAAGDGWAVPKAVKSTLAEVSGKSGEMVMGMVGRDKSGIADIETWDLERFISLVHGARSKWLWYGKSRRTGADDHGKSEPAAAHMTFTKDDHGNHMWSHNRGDSVPPDEDVEIRKKEVSDEIYSAQPPGSATSMVEIPNDRETQRHKAVFRKATGKMSEAKQGFGRIKDAVGLRGHASKHSKDEARDFDENGGYFSPGHVPATPHGLVTPSSPTINKSFTWKVKPGEYENGFPKVKDAIAGFAQAGLRESDSECPPDNSKTSLPCPTPVPSALQLVERKAAEAEEQWQVQAREIRRELVAKEPSISGSLCGEGDLEGPVLEAERDDHHNFGTILHRRHSISDASHKRRPRCEDQFKRHMSFSDAEDAVLTWGPIGILDKFDESDEWLALKNQKLVNEDYKRTYEKILDLQNTLCPWVRRRIESLDALDDQAALDQERFQELHVQLSEEYQELRNNTQDFLGEERSHVTEMLKDIEVLGAKLEYELNSLVSKVQDAEDGVSQFERQVDDLETRADELEDIFRRESWAHWIVRSVTGIGTRPNVVAPRSP
ncbi:hypothetical protein DSL72_008580 [Monilinia vaccinii-corymbosi]|uniref:STB6-like N-terminal domain-containing protein n=1 Tax=Monilinia vaccinii-corymbosi TaxID=61207 RepID=A0A8A3PPP3_9HELO|nr:hypothetical protein DSL72_008580 [Monilinia vaccinii-corymbosi]